MRQEKTGRTGYIRYSVFGDMECAGDGGCRLETGDWRLTKRAIEFGNEPVRFFQLRFTLTSFQGCISPIGEFLF
jgi:hypothetical protein